MELLYGTATGPSLMVMGNPDGYVHGLSNLIGLILIQSQDDAKLTESGAVEAQKANQAWKQQIKNGVPMPQSFYSSPLR